MYNMSRLIHFSISFSISLMQSCPAMNPITLCVLLSNEQISTLCVGKR
uniref:Uncharacterized protein n=1 Tax=Variola virus TaxID=10255 RepID=B5KIX2_VARV|nr:hypothetical protein Congo-2_R9 [Variola virus]